jgi:hypothetical protein
MKLAKLDEMVKGWFVGGFQPAAYSTDVCEVAIKRYKASEKEAMHRHMVATEVTVILFGRVRMMDRECAEGDIVVLSPGEVTDFEAVTDCATVVVKVPGALNDKYLV